MLTKRGIGIFMDEYGRRIYLAVCDPCAEKQIGRCFLKNLYAYVEHDCLVGDFVTLWPGAQINNNVSIGDEAYIGAGTIIRPGLVIDARAVIGMGAVVTRDVPSGVTVIGNPAKPMEKT